MLWTTLVKEGKYPFVTNIQNSHFNVKTDILLWNLLYKQCDICMPNVDMCSKYTKHFLNKAGGSDHRACTYDLQHCGG